MAIHMFQQLIDTLKKSPKRIVFTEGTDARILEASARLLAGTWLAPILIGNEAEVKAAAEEVGFNIRGAEIIDPATYPDMDKMVEEMVALRRGKMTADECRAALMKGNYFGTMLVKMGVADCLLGGATYSTADTVRPALQLIKTKPENKIVSSCFIMVREGVGDNTVLAMGDCAINIDPTEDELVEIGLECAKCAKTFGIDPKVAYLSYSTKGSGKGGTGKSTVSVLLGACLARLGRKTLLVELDSGLRSVDIIAGVYGRTVYDIEDVLCGRCEGAKAVVPSPLYPGLSVISAPYEGGAVEAAPLGRLLTAMRPYFDFILLDTAAGMGAPFTAASTVADKALLVLTPDPVALRDGKIVADRLLAGGRPQSAVRLVMNRVQRESFGKNAAVADLDECIDTVGVQLLAVIPESRVLQLAGANGTVPPAADPAVVAGQAMAKRLCGQRVPLTF